MEHLIIKGNFIGAAIVAIIYTVYILNNISGFTKLQLISVLIILNALTIVLLRFAFSYVK
jgi:hypothetical protein